MCAKTPSKDARVIHQCWLHRSASRKILKQHDIFEMTDGIILVCVFALMHRDPISETFHESTKAFFPTCTVEEYCKSCACQTANFHASLEDGASFCHTNLKNISQTPTSMDTFSVKMHSHACSTLIRKKHYFKVFPADFVLIPSRQCTLSVSITLDTCWLWACKPFMICSQYSHPTHQKYPAHE